MLKNLLGRVGKYGFHPQTEREVGLAKATLTLRVPAELFVCPQTQVGRGCPIPPRRVPYYPAYPPKKGPGGVSVHPPGGFPNAPLVPPLFPRERVPYSPGRFPYPHAGKGE